MKKTGIVSVILLLLISFQTKAQPKEAGWNIPSWADTTKRRFELTPSAIQEGNTLYATYCVACHGKNGNGEGAPGMSFEIKPANFHDWETMHQKDGTLF